MLAYAKIDPSKMQDDLWESIVAAARSSHSSIFDVADLGRSDFRRLARALDKIISAENTPKK